KVATQCFCYGLLELIRSDGTKVQFSKTDGEHPIICAAPINPAEAVWIEPREDGPHFVRRPATPPAPPAKPPQSSVPAAPPPDRQLPAAGGSEPLQSPRAQRQPQQPPPKEDDALSASEAVRRKRGRPTKITLELEKHIFKLLDHHGLPDPNDPEWSSQARI